MIGPCARREVTCEIRGTSGRIYRGKNWCSNAQVTCPREENEDYTKCKTICQQWGHAEEVALTLAGEDTVAASATVYGHSYACRKCQEALYAAGICTITVINHKSKGTQ